LTHRMNLRIGNDSGQAREYHQAVDTRRRQNAEPPIEPPARTDSWGKAGAGLPWFDHSNVEFWCTEGGRLQILCGLACVWRPSHAGVGCGLQTSSAPPSGNPQAAQHPWPTYSSAL
jgi:hypothetical protein